jgi:hypothetical protein
MDQIHDDLLYDKDNTLSTTNLPIWKTDHEYFEEPRHPELGQFFDFLRTWKGFQSLQNRLLYMRSVNFDWNNESNDLNDDSLRVELKKAFSPTFLAETAEKPEQ